MPRSTPTSSWRCTWTWPTLPYYLMRTSIRMLAALAASLLFSLAFAALACKSRTAEKVLVPALGGGMGRSLSTAITAGC